MLAFSNLAISHLIMPYVHCITLDCFTFSFQLNGYSKGSKVRQILADLALTQVANKRVEYLNGSERRRLAIGKMRIEIKET